MRLLPALAMMTCNGYARVGVAAAVRKAHAYRHYRYAPVRLVITSGHPLSRFPGEIEYRYLPGTYYHCCCCRRW